MRQKLNLITLGVNDFDRSVAFFEKGLDWKKSSASVEELALFPLGGIVLALHPRKDLAADVTVSPEGSGFSGITLSYNAKSETEVDEVLEKVRRLGASVIKPVQKSIGADTVAILKIWMDIFLKSPIIPFGIWMNRISSYRSHARISSM